MAVATGVAGAARVGGRNLGGRELASATGVSGSWPTRRRVAAVAMRARWRHMMQSRYVAVG